ncbi:hypothetical protein CDD80_2169 [Ophiocordyceps camponoti-rufipedis]|uniref:DUF2147 domain-containing protein n=1 Tax=Ophiocordyceps camponoti-rufipedis TaxID=2004952 RepID=A0A2C5Z7M1_9HYPO|nr:hypothetical protein CDD80_2169 [Ophiocordyceps camponoti-rufipedis]
MKTLLAATLLMAGTCLATPLPKQLVEWRRDGLRLAQMGVARSTKADMNPAESEGSSVLHNCEGCISLDPLGRGQEAAAFVHVSGQLMGGIGKTTLSGISAVKMAPRAV